jgi:hypothetical protein
MPQVGGSDKVLSPRVNTSAENCALLGDDTVGNARVADDDVSI